jgi:phage terminase large subunit GpA-like protein
MTDPTLRQALISACALLRPPPETSLAAWADANRIVPTSTSATPGRWRTAAQPAAFGPMAAVTDPATHTITVMAATQTVKSELILNSAGYFIAADPSAILIVQPTQSAAEAFAKERFSAMVASTPVLRALVPTPASRLGDSTITHRSFPGGALNFVGANAPTDLASRPVRIVCLDEIDKYPPSAGNEGDPLKLAEERASTYRNIGRSKSIRTCSPTDKATSRIAREYGFSDQRRLYVECPHCTHAQVLTWKSVDFQGAGGHEPGKAGICCEECGVKWTERERKDALSALEYAPAFGWRQTARFTCCDDFKLHPHGMIMGDLFASIAASGPPIVATRDSMYQSSILYGTAFRTWSASSLRPAKTARCFENGPTRRWLKYGRQKAAAILTYRGC